MRRVARGTRFARGRTVAVCALVCGLLGVLVSVEVGAFVPWPDRTLQAIAEVNRASGRSQALQLEIGMRFGDQPRVARGELITHPSGLARLELRGDNGRIDRYLLSGGELLGTTDGLSQSRPSPLLQPLFLLQPSSGATLRAALRSFDVASDMIGLATCGEQDCFVIGDPRLAAPLPRSMFASEGLEDDALGDPLAEPIESPATPALPSVDANIFAAGDGRAGDSLAGPELAVAEEALLPRLWVDTDELQVRRIDRSNGVFTIFGPIASFGKVRVPAWFEIHEPGRDEAIRFEVDRAVQVNAPAKAFSREWLNAPTPRSERTVPPGGAGPDPSPPGGLGPSPVDRAR